MKSKGQVQAIDRTWINRNNNHIALQVDYLIEGQFPFLLPDNKTHHKMDRKIKGK